MSSFLAAKPLNILIIEDSKADAILIEKNILSAIPEGCSIEKAETLENALKILPTKQFDVALLDRSLPDAEGFEGLHRLQNQTPQMPIVFLTAYKDEQIAMEAIGQGAQDYLFKDAMKGCAILRAIQYAIARKQYEGDLTAQAFFDNLTGLSNRMMFENRLGGALSRLDRTDKDLGILFLDLDGFKQVNDTYGHAAGDTLLREAATRLAGTVRSYDTVARFGGDEFAILIENIQDVKTCVATATKIIAAINAPFMISGQTIQIGVSIGIAMQNDNSEKSPEALTAMADAAMYEAKAQKKGSDYKICKMPTQDSVVALVRSS